MQIGDSIQATVLPLFWEMFLLTVPVFAVIGLGRLVYVIGLIRDEFLRDANRFFYYCGLPLLIVHAIGTSDVGLPGHAINFGQILGATVGFTLLFLGTHFFLARTTFTPKVKASLSQATIRGNMSYIGLAMVESAYGREGLVAAAVLLGAMIALINVLSVLALALPLGEEKEQAVPRKLSSPLFWLKEIGTNPFIIAAAVGLLIAFLRVPVPEVAERTLGMIGRMTLPLALIIIGAEFRLDEFRVSFGPVVGSSLVKLLVSPLLVGLCCWGLGARGLPLAVAVVLAAAPTSSPSFIMALQMGADAPSARGAVLLSTLLALFSTTLVLTVLGLLGLH